MVTKRPPHPHAPVAFAKLIGEIAIGQIEDRVEDGKNPAAVELARRT